MEGRAEWSGPGGAEAVTVRRTAHRWLAMGWGRGGQQRLGQAVWPDWVRYCKGVTSAWAACLAIGGATVATEIGALARHFSRNLLIRARHVGRV